jgi:hypothetical protein
VVRLARAKDTRTDVGYGAGAHLVDSLVDGGVGLHLGHLRADAPDRHSGEVARSLAPQPHLVSFT